jgi:hypothetical protein
VSALRQRHVALTWVVPVSTVLLLLVSALVVPEIPGRYSIGRYLVLLPFLVFFLWGAVQPLLWWWGADLRLDDTGLRFGTDHPRARPAQVTFVARNPWVAPWGAVSQVRVVRQASAVRSMRRAARPGAGAQPTVYGGYFPAARRAALVFDVDLGQVQLPEIRPPASRRRRLPNTAIDVSPLWAFPVRDVDPVLEALRERGVAVVESDQAVLPGRVSPVLSSDDPRLVEMWTQQLGHEPSPAELAALRASWERAGGSHG